MVQKGYGWMLKVASQAHQKEIFSYVISKINASGYKTTGITKLN
jgi:3-methyladenine DNA glycosylase AlkD